LFAFLCGLTSSFAQKEQTFFVGVNVGVKLANKNYAQRYNGVYQEALHNSINQQFTYNQIYIDLGDKHFQLPYDAYPANIKYSPGLVTGVTLGYKISPELQAGLDANFSKLKVRDVFSIEVIDPSNTTSQEQYSLGQLYAEESRFNGRFNFDYIIEGSESLKYIVGLSGIFSAWRIDEYTAFFQNTQMPLFTVHGVNNNITSKTSGGGFGGGLNLGFEYRINEKIVAQLMYQPYMNRVDYFNTKSQIQALGTAYVPDRFRLEHDITVRFLWK